MKNSDNHIVSEKKEDEDNQKIILSQWQTCVEMANSVSVRRDTCNNLFASLNLAIVAAISYIWNIKTIVLLIAGAAICIVWLLFIRNFRELNRAKFQVINEMETKLPIRPFCDEWEILENNKKYKEGTVREKILPWAFIVLYCAILVFMIIEKCLEVL